MEKGCDVKRTTMKTRRKKGNIDERAVLATHTYIHTYVRTYVHTYINTYIHTYIHSYVHSYVQTYIHTYIHTYRPTRRGFRVAPKNALAATKRLGRYRLGKSSFRKIPKTTPTNCRESQAKTTTATRTATT